MNNNSQACQYRNVPDWVYDNNSSSCVKLNWRELQMKKKLGMSIKSKLVKKNETVKKDKPEKKNKGAGGSIRTKLLYQARYLISLQNMQ